MNIKSKLRLESAYWTYVQSHPNHRELPDGALEDATEAVIWCHADRALFKSSNAPFSQDDAREMAELMKNVSELKRPTLKKWYCAAILRAICRDRLASHYGQNDAKEVRRREKAEDVEITLPYNSARAKVTWYLVASIALGAPLRYLKRINNVDRTNSGDGVNTLRWRAFLKSLCKEWTDSNLLATVLVSATVALLAIPELNGTAQIAGVISALYALSSVLCGMLLISKHQDRIESFGSTAVSYFGQAKLRTTGTVRPLAVILSLPLSFMLWGMFWFVLAVISFVYSSRPQELSHRYVLATRSISLLYLSMLVVIGIVILRFFHGIWNSPPEAKALIQPQPTTVNMVMGQGGNPLMQFSGDQHFESSLAAPIVTQVPHSNSGSYPAVVINTGRRIQTSLVTPNTTYPHSHSFQTQAVGPVARANTSPAVVNVTPSNKPTASPIPHTSKPSDYSTPRMPFTELVIAVADRNSWELVIRDQATYDAVMANIWQECEKYGPVKNVSIPKYPQGDGLIHVMFESKESAGNALANFQRSGLAGHLISDTQSYIDLRSFG